MFSEVSVSHSVNGGGGGGRGFAYRREGGLPGGGSSSREWGSVQLPRTDI